MRVIKLGIISVIVFSLLLFFISLLIPSTVRISRAIDIEAPRPLIREQLVSLEAWKRWNELANEKIDVEFGSADSSYINTSWKYNDKFVLSAFRLEESAGRTVVQWYFDFRLRWYPWEKLGSITFDEQFGPVMERSLNNLKKLVENSP